MFQTNMYHVYIYIYVRGTGSGFLRKSAGANGIKRFSKNTYRKLENIT